MLGWCPAKLRTTGASQPKPDQNVTADGDRDRRGRDHDGEADRGRNRGRDAVGARPPTHHDSIPRDAADGHGRDERGEDRAGGATSRSPATRCLDLGSWEDVRRWFDNSTHDQAVDPGQQGLHSLGPRTRPSHLCGNDRVIGAASRSVLPLFHHSAHVTSPRPERSSPGTLRVSLEGMSKLGAWLRHSG